MRTATPTASDLFAYLRGAMRATYGVEDFRGKSILLIGMSELGQEMLTRLCIDGARLYFSDDSVKNYHKAHTICPFVAPHNKEHADIVLEFTVGLVGLRGKYKAFFHADVPEPYTQGIHDFYPGKKHCQ